MTAQQIAGIPIIGGEVDALKAAIAERDALLDYYQGQIHALIEQNARLGMALKQYLPSEDGKES